MATVVGIASIHSLTIEVHQPNRSKLALYKLLLYFNSHLKQLFRSNKTEHFSYKGGVAYLGVPMLKH